MGEFAIGQGVPRFEDPRLLRGGGKYVDDITLPLHGLRPRAALAARACENPQDRHRQGQGRARRARGADRRRLDQVRLGRSSGSRDPQAARRLAELQAALSGAGEGPRALRRRLRRLRGRRDQEPGDGRLRADRGGLRGASGRGRHRGGRQARRAAGLGGLQGQYLLHGDPRRQGQDRGGVQERRPHRQAASGHQPRHHRFDGAARLGRRLQRHHRQLHDLHDLAARASLSRGAGETRAQGARAQGARDRPRHRRQLRHEVGDLQRGAAGAARLQDHRTAGEVDEHALGGVPLRRDGARQRDRCRTRTRQGRHVPRVPRLVVRQRRRLSAVRLPGLYRQSRNAGGRLSHARDVRRVRPRCSATPSRAVPIAATAGRKRPT